MDKKKLTPKQQRFVEEYCSNGFNATKAAVKAGYSQKTAKDIACETLAKPYIQDSVRAFMGKQAKKCEVTIESLAKELDENRKIALNLDTPQVSAANQSTLGKAKLFGLDVQRVEQTNKNIQININDESISPQEAADVYKDLLDG